MRTFWSVGCLALALVGFLVTSARGKSPEPAAEEAVDLFAAIQAGDLDVKLFLKDAAGGAAVIKNTSKRPLSIKLPGAFAAVPVAAQFGLGGAIGGLGGPNGAVGAGKAGGAGAGTQAIGGGFGAGVGANVGNNGNRAGGGGPFGMPGAFFNIEAGKERKLKLVSVCLEHGKDEPTPRIAYEIKPLESVASQPQVSEVVRQLAAGKLDQKTAQAAAWHLANGLSWQELAQKVKARHLNGLTERFFTPDEISRAKGAVSATASLVKQSSHSLVSASQTE